MSVRSIESSAPGPHVDIRAVNGVSAANVIFLGTAASASLSFALTDGWLARLSWCVAGNLISAVLFVVLASWTTRDGSECP